MSDKPEFGYGAGGRPLWTARDRDAEMIWAVMHTAGRREFGARVGQAAASGDGTVADGRGGAPAKARCGAGTMSSRPNRCGA
ncbi:hypothetical protein [Nonomuraea gerenzanensis]|uniref:hypothetical protein n=1 Tax=Nonomuraea gerenzanensis TaxID=93944 RepID=UPI001CDA1F93|nr:hypothetical protein [Nonomuraea gerenzanensis]UBU18666.1 hypothetical protein LCN96_27715 [Nonomuraea gerenzanensis]